MEYSMRSILSMIAYLIRLYFVLLCVIMYFTLCISGRR